MNTISEKYVINHILENYGQLRHNPKKLVNAVRKTAKDYSLNKIDLFHYIIERKQSILGTTSYGFDTAYGREIRSTFEYYYYN